MELLAPAGTKEKIEVAYHYGADAAYIGGLAFNLRAQSNNFTYDELVDSIALAKQLDKKLYLTLNASLHEYDLQKLKDYIKSLENLNFDAFIVADLGVFSILKEIIPQANVHISTQANVTNSAACNKWQSLGASRIILARELSLEEIKAIRDETDVELEVFVHGAVCMSYSGRCLLSNSLTGRDANVGDCSQVCRWQFKTYIEEATRPGEFMPIEEQDGHTTILSAKDLQMAEYLNLIQDAGVDAIKIEGRMKSVYYVANVVRVYRMLLDVLNRMGTRDYQEAIKKEPVASYLSELSTISRRESDSAFFLRGRNRDPNIVPALNSYKTGRRLMGMVISTEGNYAMVRVYNTIHENKSLIYIGRDFLNCTDDRYELFIKNEMNEFIRVTNIRNVDLHAYIRSSVRNLSQYDIITLCMD